MESLDLKKAKQNALKEENKLNIEQHSRFNFGNKQGAVLTSTSNSKAHSFNKFDRKRKELHEQNISKMVEDFNKGFVSKKKKKISKNANRYNQRLKSKIENVKIKETINLVSSLLKSHKIYTNII